MHILSNSNVFLAFLLTTFMSVTRASSNVAPEVSAGTKTGILFNPVGFPPLPSPATTNGPSRVPGANVLALNLTNIQADILVGMRQINEIFFFFRINSVTDFKSKLRSGIVPLITSAQQLSDPATHPAAMVNIAFSHAGLTTIGAPVDILDGGASFNGGQAAQASTLQDITPIEDHWVPAFLNGSGLHGVFLVASDTVAKLDAQVSNIKNILGDSISEVYNLQGQMRPGAEMGHEHFGFLDGISQPGLQGFTTNPVKGQDVIQPGIILVGEPGDSKTARANTWAKDGSFLAFRQLKQMVPEFNKFLSDNPIRAGVNSTAEGSQLLGARMMGRWKSGTPIELSPLHDNLTIASDPNLNNNFNFTLAADASRCPFSAHIRKTNPRADLPHTAVDPHRIIRAGLPYGPEVTAQEASSNTTSTERGLAFVAYQSDISAGFEFLQETWANNPGFLSHNGFPPPGFDPIIGQNSGQPRNVSSLDLADQTRTITLSTDFVQSRGGEYFFSPSISAIANTLAV